MRKLILVGCIGLAVSGCNWHVSNDETAVQVCEGYIKDKLKAPATYNRVDVTVGMPVEGQPTRDVFVSYDAANSYGTPLRSIQKCTFDVLANGKFPDANIMSLGVGNARLADAMASINPSNRGIGDDLDSFTTCCKLDDAERKQFLNK